uniref:Reverse transcriptase domain-containing protein n=1 Tax=Tanacetum cinerariifolium TaxID=118510 RepID=A0A699HWB6_TANCI|nr:reverse transcriptase domain-containing protein [Tanacetum cinerariifolium]
MDGGSSCEIIYESCFEKLNPTIKATKVDLKTPLVRFLGERSWSIGRTVMQRMGIVDSTIHGAIKFHTKKGIGTVILTYEANQGKKMAKRILPQVRKGSSVTSTLRKKLSWTTKERTKARILQKAKHQTWVANPDRSMAAGKKQENVCGLHRHKQGLFQRLLPTTRDQLENRITLRVPFEVVPRCLQGLPPNANGRRRRRQNSLLRKRRSLLLQKDAVSSQKCKGNIPKVSEQDQEINANMVFTAQMEKVLSDLEESSSSKEETIVEICLCIIDSGCSKHMTGNRALLTNFVEKFLGTVRFGNNDFAVIVGMEMLLSDL